MLPECEQPWAGTTAVLETPVSAVPPSSAGGGSVKVMFAATTILPAAPASRVRFTVRWPAVADGATEICTTCPAPPASVPSVVDGVRPLPSADMVQLKVCPPTLLAMIDSGAGAVPAWASNESVSGVTESCPADRGGLVKVMASGMTAVPAAAASMVVGVGFAVVGLLVAAWIASHFVSGPPLASVGGWTVAAWFIAWPVIGFAYGKRRRRDHCSDPSCNAVVPLSASVCPGCGGTIAATLKSRDERLDAEERLGLNRADYDADVGTESGKLARGARPLFTPAGVAGGLIGADVHEGDDEETERGTSSTVV